MPLCNCKDCGDLYIKHTSIYCDDCRKVNNAHYVKVRNFLKSNPHSTVMDVHVKTGISLTKLLEWNKDEYVPFSN
jgi:hypothetical protein